MIKQILVCLEGSPSTEAATRISIAYGRELGAALVGLAVVDEPDIRAGAAVGIGGTSFKHERDEALVADAHIHASEWLKEFERLCREAGIEARTLEIVGRPTESILHEMGTRDLTVMGRDANFKFETEPEDSGTRDAILHRATGPVLVVPEEVIDHRVSKTVVIAYDGSGAAKRALGSFAGSGLAEGREVHVATVDDNGAEAYEMANRGVLALRAMGITAKPNNIVSPLSNVDALFAFAQEIGAGLMVMGAFARSRVATFFRGSVTQGIVERTRIPLLLQH
jgi:nucleotide-binding universal stress UspA family protein